MLDLFVLDAATGSNLPAAVSKATDVDLAATRDWQTDWTSKDALDMPNKVALKLRESGELLGLMSYELREDALAVRIVYVESAAHSNANLLHATGGEKKYIGVAKALFAYAIEVSMDAGYDGVLVFRAKGTELLDYYKREFGARQVASYDPFQLVIWEDEAAAIIAEYRRDN